MTKADDIQPSASIASTGKGIRYVGRGNPPGIGSSLNYIGVHAYLYTGVIGVTGDETTLFETDVAANQYIVAKLQIFNGSFSNDSMTYKIYINNQIVGQYTVSQLTTNLYTSDEPIEIILAPLSTLKVTAQSEGVSARSHTASLTGRVYGAT